MPRPWRCAPLLIALAFLAAGCSLVGGSAGPSPAPASVPPAAQRGVDASISALASQQRLGAPSLDHHLQRSPDPFHPIG
jgi:hypothetical protein